MKKTLALLLVLAVVAAVLCACGEKATDQSSSSAAESATESPTEPSYLDAYRAYRTELETNRDSITDYNWQLSGGETRPVVFADIMGDSTPEMIYAYAQDIVQRGASGESNRGTVGLRILTYRDGAVKQVYENQKWSQNAAQVNAPYTLFQTKGNNTLYAFCDTSKTYRGFKVFRYNDTGDGLAEELLAEYSDIETDPGQSKFVVEGENTTKEAAEQYASDLLNNNDSALMISEIETDNNGKVNDHLQFLGVNTLSMQNEALTYTEAIDFLNK